MRKTAILRSFVKLKELRSTGGVTRAIDTSPTNITARTDSSENFPRQEDKVTPADLGAGSRPAPPENLDERLHLARSEGVLPDTLRSSSSPTASC
jgi:hypothetical protein